MQFAFTSGSQKTGAFQQPDLEKELGLRSESEKHFHVVPHFQERGEKNIRMKLEQFL